MVKSPALASWSGRPGIKHTQAPTIDREANSRPYLLAAGGLRSARPRLLPDPACPKGGGAAPPLARSPPYARLSTPLGMPFCIAQLCDSHIDYIVDLT